MQKILLKTLFFVLILSLFLFPKITHADEQFGTSYNVTYDVSEQGITQVTEVVTLKNLTDKYYPTSFGLTIGATQLSDIQASDNNGLLQTTSSNLGNKTQINVKFNNSQVIGKGKLYSYTLKFTSTDFAQSQGKVWQITVPKIGSSENLDLYTLKLKVPVSFGDPASIQPDPKSETEDAGKVVYTFDKDQLTKSGVLANFGNDQLLSFSLHYNLVNTSILPKLVKVSFPSNTLYQQVIINSISPKPENVISDNDGNSAAYFKVDRKATLTPIISGMAKLSFNPIEQNIKLSEDQTHSLTAEQKYWEVNNPQIKAKLNEIFAKGKPPEIKDQASLIYKYVVSNLQFDDTRIKDKNFDRLGALTVLNNPQKALSEEFVDLFVTLMRSDGIPSRQLAGYAYTSNTNIRPLSYEGTSLHTWAEYSDPNVGWVRVDPTWENTTGGVDYFSKFDLNHFVLNTHGYSSTDPESPTMADISFTDKDFQSSDDLKLTINVSNDLYAGFPSKGTIRVENTGNSTHKAGLLTLNSSQILFSDNKKNASSYKSFDVPALPPGGFLEYNYDLNTGSLWQSYDDVIQFSVDNTSINKKVTVQPLFAYRIFTVALILIVGLMIAVYIFILALHVKVGTAHHHKIH